MNNKTIIYYTSNRENPLFEKKIQDNILKSKGQIPVISVSQKPIDFGHNICVGDVGHSYLNEYRQILIGAKASKTEYVVFAESDFLYPPFYFNFETSGHNIYRYNNVWIVFKEKLYSFRKKRYSEGAQICKRDYLIKILEEYLDNGPEWYDGVIQNKDRQGKVKKDTFNVPFELFGDNTACISFKTGMGMRMNTDVMHGRENISMKLPYWGHVAQIRKEFLGQ